MNDQARNATVIATVREWQTRILQLDRRNALLYFPQGKRGVRLVNGTPDQVVERLSSSKAGLEFLYCERRRTHASDRFDATASAIPTEPELDIREGDLETDVPPLELQRRLAALKKRNREWQDEQGINVMFLALGFLHWFDEDDEPAISPLLLLPCDLNRVSPRDPFRLVGDESDDLVINHTLHHKLANDAGLDLPEPGDETISAYLARVRHLIGDRDRWRVEESVVLATFPYSKLAMWEDLERIAEAGVVHPLVRRLAGDASASIADPQAEPRAIPDDTDLLAGGGLDDLLDVRDQHAILRADFSQLRAIELARSGRSLVIHGPPGTGKSQTIANIIATLLAEGRRVLFVSEKTAALDVVKRRLAESGLGTFCLDLHSERGKKSSVYAQLRESADAPRVSTGRFSYDRLLARRGELNAVVRALHEIRKPIDLSVFAVHGRLAAIREAPRIAAAVRDLNSLDGQRLRQIEQAASRVVRRAREFAEHTTSRWHALNASTTSPRLADLVREDMEQMHASATLLRDTIALAADACGTIPPSNDAGAGHLIEILDLLEKAPRSVPSHWMTPAALRDVSATVADLRRQIADRARALDLLHPAFGPTCPTNEARSRLARVRVILRDAERWTRIGGEAWSRDLVIHNQHCAAAYRALGTAVNAVHDRLRALLTALNRAEDADSRFTMDSAIALAEKLHELAPIPDGWDSVPALDAIRTKVLAARDLALELLGAETDLRAAFDDEFVDLVDVDFLARFRADYQSFWRRLGGSYRRDQRAIRANMRQPRRLGVGEAIAAIERALNVKRLRQRWTHTDAGLRDVLGERLRGRETLWENVLERLDALAAIYRDNPTQIHQLAAILRSPERCAALGVITKSVRAAIATLENALRGLPIAMPEGDRRAISSMAADALAFAAAADEIGAILAELGPLTAPPSNVQRVEEVLAACVELCELEERAAEQSGERARRLGEWFTGWDTDCDAIYSALGWSRAILELVRQPLPAKLLERIENPSDAQVYSRVRDELHAARRTLQQASAAINERFPAENSPWRNWSAAPLSDLITWCEDLARHADESVDWAEYCDATAQLDDVVGAGTASAARKAFADSALVQDAVMRHVYLAWLDLMHGSVPELRFSPRDMEAARAEFCELDSKLPNAARERVRASCLTRYPGRQAAPEGMGQLGILHHEMAKRKRQMSVRNLVAAIPNLLQTLKPCFMMSPLAASQFLPRGAGENETLTFDTVVFDEASQVFPEDAVPAIGRCKQLIVVGDRQQLPPSAFFRKDTEGDDDDDDDQSQPSSNQLLGMESILDVLVGMHGSGVEDVHLEVHYRSRHDDLIRYSNHYFYGDRLLTFPSANASHPGLGLTSVYLPNGRFDAGGTRTNRIEAERVVQIVFDLLERRPPHESIGVVALSRPQADCIQQLIDERRLVDRRFDNRFAEDQHERFFVKNLENVQGDERDHIVLSVGYGPTAATGLVPNRFGPVNAEGGQRRLNVAVSRARNSMTVVHSVRPEDIRSESEGARLLRRYLEFLATRAASFEGAVTANPTADAESPFEESVGRALEGRGYRIQRQVGCAKYAIDIAVMAEDGSGFDLGIECDGAMYHRSPTARDRDWLRQQILERLGWRIHRVWSTAWIRNPTAQLEAIERAITEARADRRLQFDRGQVFETVPDGEVAHDIVPSTSGNDTPSANPVDAPTGASPLLAPYVQADLRSFRRRGDLRDENAAHLGDLVAVVVRVEQPVHDDVVIERICEHYRIQRAGSRIRAALMRGIEVAVLRGQVERISTPSIGCELPFLVEAGAQEIVPRGPGVDGSTRSIEQIAYAEIAAALVAVVRATYGAARADAITATARALGFARLGEHVETRISSALDRSLAAGEVVERMGTIVVA